MVAGGGDNGMWIYILRRERQNRQFLLSCRGCHLPDIVGEMLTTLRFLGWMILCVTLLIRAAIKKSKISIFECLRSSSSQICIAWPWQPWLSIPTYSITIPSIILLLLLPHLPRHLNRTVDLGQAAAAAPDQTFRFSGISWLHSLRDDDDLRKSKRDRRWEWESRVRVTR